MQSLPDLPDDRCQVCGQPAPFKERELATGDCQLYCLDHIPDTPEWGFMPPSLAKLLEREYLASRSNDKSPPVVSG